MRELVIIGGGPAGLTAGIYACRAKLDVVLVEKGLPGGQAATTHWVDNFPGFPEGVSGPELMSRMEDQARRLGLEIIQGEVTALDPHGEEIGLTLEGGQTLASRAVIIATGAAPRQLGVPGEDRLRGRGVSYCATCDGAFFAGKKVAVVGGGDTAITEALFLTRFATQVTVIHRREELRATPVLREEAMAHSRLSFLWNTEVVAIEGEQKVQTLRLRNRRTGEEQQLPVDGVFIAVGLVPNTAFLRGVVALDDGGYVITDEQRQTSVRGVFAAGDVRQTPLRQIITAAADGALSAVGAERYLAGHA